MANRTPLTVKELQERIRDLEREIEQYRSPERLKVREMVRAQELGDFMWTGMVESGFSIPETWLLTLRERKKGWVFEGDVLADDGLGIVHKEKGMVTLQRKAGKSQ